MIRVQKPKSRQNYPLMPKIIIPTYRESLKQVRRALMLKVHSFRVTLNPRQQLPKKVKMCQISKRKSRKPLAKMPKMMISKRIQSLRILKSQERFLISTDSNQMPQLLFDRILLVDCELIYSFDWSQLIGHCCNRNFRTESSCARA